MSISAIASWMGHSSLVLLLQSRLENFITSQRRVSFHLQSSIWPLWHNGVQEAISCAVLSILSTPFLRESHMA